MKGSLCNLLIRAPFLPFQGRSNLLIPLILMGVLSVLGGLVALRLPETLNTSLPNTVQEGEAFGRDFGWRDCLSCGGGREEEEEEGRYSNQFISILAIGGGRKALIPATVHTKRGINGPRSESPLIAKLSLAVKSKGIPPSWRNLSLGTFSGTLLSASSPDPSSFLPCFLFPRRRRRDEVRGEIE